MDIPPVFWRSIYSFHTKSFNYGNEHAGIIRTKSRERFQRLEEAKTVCSCSFVSVRRNHVIFAVLRSEKNQNWEFRFFFRSPHIHCPWKVTKWWLFRYFDGFYDIATHILLFQRFCILPSPCWWSYLFIPTWLCISLSPIGPSDNFYCNPFLYVIINGHGW